MNVNVLDLMGDIVQKSLSKPSSRKKMLQLMAKQSETFFEELKKLQDMEFIEDEDLREEALDRMGPRESRGEKSEGKPDEADEPSSLPATREELPEGVTGIFDFSGEALLQSFLTSEILSPPLSERE